MKRTVFLRFLLKYGHVIDVSFDESDAERILKKWSNLSPGKDQLFPANELKEHGIDRLFNRLWAVDLLHVQGIVSLDPNQAQTQPPQQTNSLQQTSFQISNPLPANSSGL